jgi:hypothetical protein
MEERKGFLTPEEEEKLHKILKLKGIVGVIDGPVIKLLDNLGLEKLKSSLGEHQDILPTIYLVIDEIFAAIPEPA